MLGIRLPNKCTGRGECFRRFTKYYYYKHDNVKCVYDCVLISCTDCKCYFPKWHFELFSSGKCYECNKSLYPDETDSAEDELRSDASLASDVSYSDEED